MRRRSLHAKMLSSIWINNNSKKSPARAKSFQKNPPNIE